MDGFVVDPESILQVAERAWDLLLRITRSARVTLQSMRYEVLTKNMMDMDGRAIETQSRIRKRKTVWQVEFNGSPLWMQVESFWSMPVGSPLYICRRATIQGRRGFFFAQQSQTANFGSGLRECRAAPLSGADTSRALFAVES
jgi:hypothetical protein